MSAAYSRPYITRLLYILSKFTRILHLVASKAIKGARLSACEHR